MTYDEALQCNIDVAQSELDRRCAEGEDVSHLRVCQHTARIVLDTPVRPSVEGADGNFYPVEG